MEWLLYYLALGFFTGIAMCLKAMNIDDKKSKAGLVEYLLLLGFVTTCWPGIFIYWLMD
jgi:hypothetical protein